MFLVTMYHVKDDCRRVRKTFHSLHDAEEYCDYYANKGWEIYSLECCDFMLSNLLLTCWAA